MGKGHNMNNNILRKDFKNKGGYKTKITSNKITVVDTNSINKVEAHINKVTDTLFLGLSRGVRTPAMYTGSIYYDNTYDMWKVKNNLNQSYYFLGGVSSTKSGDKLQTLDITINEDILAKSDSTPLYFVHNMSTNGSYNNNYIIFPRISSIVDNIVTISMESNNSGTWGYYETSTQGEEGLQLGFDAILQTYAEDNDRSFYTPSIPDWTYNTTTTFENSISFDGYVYNTIVETSDIIDWECKVKARAIEWSGDCETGSPVLGSLYIYSSTVSAYTTGLHISNIYNLLSATKYKVWVQIDSKIGQDNLTWKVVNCFVTKSVGGGRDPIPDLP